MLVLAGDIFQRWADDGRAPHPELVPVVDALARVAPRRIFTPGNHDWAAGGFLARHLDAEVTLTARLTLDGCRILVSHGDEADGSLGYRALRRVVRSGLVGALRTALGPARTWRLEGALGHAPEGEPDPALIAAQRARAREVLAHADVDVVVNGHTHAPCVEAHPGGLWVNLGDGHHTWCVLDGGTPTLTRHPP